MMDENVIRIDSSQFDPLRVMLDRQAMHYVDQLSEVPLSMIGSGLVAVSLCAGLTSALESGDAAAVGFNMTALVVMGHIALERSGLTSDEYQRMRKQIMEGLDDDDAAAPSDQQLSDLLARIGRDLNI